MKPKMMLSVKSLENYFEKCKKEGCEMNWRISETPSKYIIKAEQEFITGSDTLAYYKTGKWSEIVEFCSTHCNTGYDLISGLGCTESELCDATTEHIHSLGKKMRYE